jgi:hypothetical protein
MGEAERMSDSLLTQRIKVLLARRHAGHPGRPDWSVFFELRDGTGFRSSGQQMDVFAMHTWPSKGFHRVGYEIKVSRADFLREMRAPEKRAWAMSITHEFWFVAPPKVIEAAEVPVDCGLMLVTGDGDGLRTLKVAPQRDASDLDMSGVAAIVRKAAEDGPLRTTRWKRAGREITDDDLAAIIAEQRTSVEEREFEKRVAEEVRGRTRRMRDGLARYAEALRLAGCEPPAWMREEEGHLFYVNEWDAQNWVADNVRPGPGGRAAADALRSIEAAVREVHKAQEQIGRLLKDADGQAPPTQA